MQLFFCGNYAYILHYIHSPPVNLKEFSLIANNCSISGNSQRNIFCEHRGFSET